MFLGWGCRNIQAKTSRGNYKKWRVQIQPSVNYCVAWSNDELGRENTKSLSLAWSSCSVFVEVNQFDSYLRTHTLIINQENQHSPQPSLLSCLTSQQSRPKMDLCWHYSSGGALWPQRQCDGRGQVINTNVIFQTICSRTQLGSMFCSMSFPATPDCSLNL